MIKAAKTPGTQPKKVKIRTINTEPQPLSITAKGGSTIASKTLQILIAFNNSNAKVLKKNKP
jgi:hypothetical protein